MSLKLIPVNPFYKDFYFVAEKELSTTGYRVQLHIVYDTYTDVFAHEGYRGLPRVSAGFIRGTLDKETTHLSEKMFDKWAYLETITDEILTKEVYYGR